MNIHRKNPYRLSHEDKREDTIAFYGSVIVAVTALAMIIGGLI